MEFWLVEAVEPALNRQQGATIGFEAQEFLQREDPELRERRESEIKRELVENLFPSRRR
jgi:hypothetical protein